MAGKHCSLLTLQVFILKHLIVIELYLNVVVIKGLICFQFVSLVTHCNKQSLSSEYLIFAEKQSLQWPSLEMANIWQRVK